MSSKKKLFTSESVSEGHPDKLCDQISDAVLDELIKQDPMSRVACECFATTGLVLVGGEITTEGYIDVQDIARNVIKDIGYTQHGIGFDADSCAVISSIHSQSPDIAMGVDTGGAGDQGMMFGYACKETDELMPAPIMYAHRIVQLLAKIRKEGKLNYLRPDSKSQVTVEYRDGQPYRIDTIVVSTQHEGSATQEQIRKDIISYVIPYCLPVNLLDSETKIYVNPTGRFEVGGPHGDTGLTGRKIIVDTYGGYAPHGGGAFSGKDPTKVDRSAAYAARHLAKNVVAAGLAERCQIQVAYAIGIAEPVSLLVDTFGTNTVSEEEIERKLQLIDMTPKGIISRLDLRKPIYRNTAAYGHFGRPEFSWEKTDLVDVLSK